MKVGDIVYVKPSLNLDLTYGNVKFTVYHVGLRGKSFKLEKQTSKGNWYSPQKTCVFSEKMLVRIPVEGELVRENKTGLIFEVAENNFNAKVISIKSKSGVIDELLYVEFVEGFKIYENNENQLSNENRIAGPNDNRKGNPFRSRRHEASIAIGHLSYQARTGKGEV